MTTLRPGRGIDKTTDRIVLELSREHVAAHATPRRQILGGEDVADEVVAGRKSWETAPAGTSLVSRARARALEGCRHPHAAKPREPPRADSRAGFVSFSGSTRG